MREGPALRESSCVFENVFIFSEGFLKKRLENYSSERKLCRQKFSIIFFFREGRKVFSVWHLLCRDIPRGGVLTVFLPVEGSFEIVFGFG